MIQTTFAHVFSPSLFFGLMPPLRLLDLATEGLKNLSTQQYQESTVGIQRICKQRAKVQNLETKWNTKESAFRSLPLSLFQSGQLCLCNNKRINTNCARANLLATVLALLTVDP